MLYTFPESERTLEIDSEGTWYIGPGNGRVELRCGNGQAIIHPANGQVIIHAGNGQVIIQSGNGQVILDGRVISP